MNPATIRRVVWPERGPLFAVVGGIVSLAGDFALGNIASAQILVWPAVGLAGVFSWFCLGQVGKLAALRASLARAPGELSRPFDR